MQYGGEILVKIEVEIEIESTYQWLVLYQSLVTTKETYIVYNIHFPLILSLTVYQMHKKLSHLLVFISWNESHDFLAQDGPFQHKHRCCVLTQICCSNTAQDKGT